MTRPAPLARLGAALRAALRRSDGGASVEFVIVFPIFMVVFFSSFEASMLTVRQMMLERSLDLTARDMRLTTGATWSREDIVARVCRNARILNDCQDRMVVEMTQINRTTYAVPAVRQPCVDMVNDVTPTTTWDNTSNQELVLLRACYAVDTFMPGAGLGMTLVASNDGDGDGEPDTDTLRMMAATVFVREPPTVASVAATSVISTSASIGVGLDLSGSASASP